MTSACILSRHKIGRKYALDADFTKLGLGSMSASDFLLATGLTYTCSTSGVTVQTDENTIVSGVGADRACIGALTSLTEDRGLVIQPSSINFLSSPNMPRDLRGTAGWTTGGATAPTYSASGGPAPDGFANVNHFAIPASQFATYFSLGTSVAVNASAWYKAAVGSAATGQIVYNNSAVNTGRAKPLTGISTSVWKRFDMHKPIGTTVAAFTVCDGRNYAGVGGYADAASSLYVDFVQLEFGQTYCTEAMPVGGSAYSNRRLSYANGQSLVSTNGQMKLDVQFQPMWASTNPVAFWDVGASSMNASSPWYLMSWGTGFSTGENYIRVGTNNKVQVVIAGSVGIESTNALVFAQYDRIQLQVFVGNNIASVCRYRIWDSLGNAWGSWVDLVLAAVSNLPAPGANPVGLFMNQPASGTGATGQPPVRIQRITCW